jgi:predicted DNA-binding transcriptional regulator AlpA
MQDQIPVTSSDSDFREGSLQNHPLRLIGPAEFAALIGITLGAFRTRDMRGEFPPPIMRKNRCVRWRFKDVCEWLQGLQPQEKRPNGKPKPRRGRKRQSTSIEMMG